MARDEPAAVSQEELSSRVSSEASPCTSRLFRRIIADHWPKDHAMELDGFSFIAGSVLSSRVLSSVVIFGSGWAGSALCSSGQCPFSGYV